MPSSSNPHLPWPVDDNKRHVSPISHPTANSNPPSSPPGYSFIPSTAASSSPSIDTTSSPSPAPPFIPRVSTRLRTPFVRLNDYVVSSVTDSCSKHDQSQFVDYSLFHFDHLCFLNALERSVEPSSYTQAIKHIEWIDAMKTELLALENNHTWEVVFLPDGKKSYRL